MEKVIIVKSTGKKTTGTIEDANKVNIPTSAEIETNIQRGMSTIIEITSEEPADPLQAVKHCSRCMKLGRVFIHKLTDFTLKADGKRHSQCKTCRSEQACEWQQKAAVKLRRKEYQRNYQAGRIRPIKHSPLVDSILGDSAQPEKVDASKSMFVAYTETQ